MLNYKKLPGAGLLALFLCTAPALAQSVWEEEAWDADTEHVVPAHSMVVLSTAVVPPEEKAAANERAEKAIASVAKISENPPGSGSKAHPSDR